MTYKNKRKQKYNPLYQNFLKLKINPIDNNKFLTWKLIRDKYDIYRWTLTKNSSKKKWEKFLDGQLRSQKFFNRFRPYSTKAYKANKFASHGNSYKKKFKNNLLIRTAFSFIYGGLSKKYLKTQMAKIYKSNKIKNSKNNSAEFFESRLDAVLYRSKFFTSVRDARQRALHKHVKVNGLIEKNKDYILKKGDIITFTKKTRKFIKKNIEKKFKKSPNLILWPMPPKYLNINYKTLEISMGNIKTFDFSSSFTFKLEDHSIIKNNYRY